MKLEDLCLNCMLERQGEGVCPHCGWQAGSLPQAAVYLRPGTSIHDKYCVGGVLGHGGFGITYLGWDINLETRIAIKEYLPRDLATRAQNRNTVVPYSGEAGSAFEYGLEKFVEEARALARLADHPGIVTVRDYFRENGTAYLVMVYLRGSTLKEYLKQKGVRLPFETALKIMMAVMDTVREIHGSGMIHRDISPDNIYITGSGQIKILDFGAARYAVGEYSKSLSIILKAGYAPEEQYRSRGNQGPWTDVYAVAATLYHAITGVIPPEALDRMAEDTLKPPSKLGAALPSQCEAALMKALALRASDRFQSIKEFQEAMSSTFFKTDPNLKVATPIPSPPTIEPEGIAESPLRSELDQNRGHSAVTNAETGLHTKPAVGLSLFYLLAFLGVAWILFSSSRKEPALPATGAQQSSVAQTSRWFPPADAKAGDIWREPSTDIEFVWVPGGCYQMGCGPWTGNCSNDQQPAHNVCVAGCWIGKYEVTQGQWKKVMGYNPSKYKKGDNYPVESVSWDEAKKFIEKINTLRGRYEFRLPTEAEWEYACRSGGKEELYSGGNDVNKVAWNSSNSEGETHPVGTKEGNGLGLHDMSGNVLEWCEDAYGERAYSEHSRSNPLNAYNGADVNRVIRGGKFWDYPARYYETYLRCVHRGHMRSTPPSVRYEDLGFRLVTNRF